MIYNYYITLELTGQDKIILNGVMKNDGLFNIMESLEIILGKKRLKADTENKKQVNLKNDGDRTLLLEKK